MTKFAPFSNHKMRPTGNSMRERIPEVVADLIADEKVIGWFPGQDGIRAKGARSAEHHR